MNKDIIYQNYRLLALTVTKYAVMDYKRALRGKNLKEEWYVKKNKSLTLAQECEDFFRSDYFNIITNLDGEEVIKRSRSKVPDSVVAKKLDEINGRKK